MRQNAEGATALNSPKQQLVEGETSHSASGLPMILQEVIDLQPVEKLEAEGLRRSGRIPREVAILLIGSDAQGKDFMEQTKTVVLSRHGAGIISAHKLAVEQEITMVYVSRDREAAIRVVGQIGSEDDSYTYGVAFLDSDIDFWDVEFPSATDAENSACRLVLQCCSCDCREVIDPGALESDVYAIHDSIIRHCKRCNSSTLWKQTSGEVPVESPVSEAAPAFPEPSPAPFKNRRQHVRTKVSFTASVRNEGFDEDIVLCENVSRGGLCFKSNRRYYETVGIEVAAPYSPGSPRIPVPAQIVYVQELPEEKMFRYGVQYLPVTKVSSSCCR
jgi:PilZ domain-containing protein